LWIKLELVDDTRRRLTFKPTDVQHQALLTALKREVFGIRS
jgi:hypothetical protein